MIDCKKGNLLTADVEALVNTVNCVGVMGRGIALQFKQAFPDNFKAYERACRAEEVYPGSIFITEISRFTNPRYVLNFPTKRHWKAKSKIEDIKSGLDALIADIKRLKIQSIAVPPLGCGNGGLDWEEVRPLIEQAFSQVSDVNVWLYAPSGSPTPDGIRIGTEKPKLTHARALFIALMEAYSVPGYRLSMLEIQKLAYFLQAVGEPLRLRFKAHYYGPYADNLNHVLQALDGHYIRGYGDRSKDAQVYLLPKAKEEAEIVLKNDQASMERLDRVKDIIEGFETPHGMELLASVHWVGVHDPAYNVSQIIQAVHAWTPRKAKIFKPHHIEIAWKRLCDTGLITSKEPLG